MFRPISTVMSGRNLYMSHFRNSITVFRFPHHSHSLVYVRVIAHLAARGRTQSFATTYCYIISPNHKTPNDHPHLSPTPIANKVASDPPVGVLTSVILHCSLVGSTCPRFALSANHSHHMSHPSRGTRTPWRSHLRRRSSNAPSGRWMFGGRRFSMYMNIYIFFDRPLSATFWFAR